MLANFKKTGLALGLLACVLSTSGCFLILGAAAGVGGYAYVSGVLEKNFTVPAGQLEDATKKGLKDLKLVLESEESDRLSAKYRSTLADGNAVKIDIKALTEKTSVIRIRIGIIGDKSKSEMVLNAVQKHL
jgi:hypothetical protein